MKKLLMLCPMMLWLLLSINCQQVLKTETKNINQAFHYTLDAANGTIVQFANLSKAEFLGKLKLPSNARITRVEIQSLSCNVKVNPNNKASKATVSGFFIEILDSEHEYEHKMFDKKEITLSPVSGVWVGWVPINTLVGEGIGMLKTQLAKWLAEYNDYTGESIQLMLVGASTPTNSRLVMDFDLRIDASIQYEYCLTTSKLMGGEGFECEDAITN
ncbi:MAG: hypothetical protein EHM72_19775 [Calditrichaeota bacterium]|nr:MAG: hypothetical protein EHM72_19775 [Calditrichota bacterium]